MNDMNPRARALAILVTLSESPTVISLNAAGDPTGIQLYQSGITDDQMECFRYFPTFEAISLGECPITDAGLAHLSELHRLEYLDLIDNFRITDAGLVHLRMLPSLRELNLFGCTITDSGLAQLASVGTLRTLTVDEENRNLSDAGMAHLIAAIPGLRIFDAMGAQIA